MKLRRIAFCLEYFGHCSKTSEKPQILPKYRNQGKLRMESLFVKILGIKSGKMVRCNCMLISHKSTESWILEISRYLQKNICFTTKSSEKRKVGRKKTKRENMIKEMKVNLMRKIIHYPIVNFQWKSRILVHSLFHE